MSRLKLYAAFGLAALVVLSRWGFVWSALVVVSGVIADAFADSVAERVRGDAERFLEVPPTPMRRLDAEDEPVMAGTDGPERRVRMRLPGGYPRAAAR